MSGEMQFIKEKVNKCSLTYPDLSRNWVFSPSTSVASSFPFLVTRETKLKLLKCMYTFRDFFRDYLNPLTGKRGTVFYFLQNLLQMIFAASSTCQK